jgi:hypothetical protein
MHTDSQTGQLLHDYHHRTIGLLNAFEGYIERTAENRIPVLDAPEDRDLLAARGEELGQGLERHFEGVIPFRKCCFVSILSFRLTFVLMASCWSSRRPRHDTTMGSRPDVGAWRGSANRVEELR